MPQPALHVLLARRTLERWRRSPRLAPLPLDAPGVETHFLHDALGPDMGLFPGAEKHVSKLVHTRRTGAMVRALRDHARTPAERAYVLGWLTHVLADVAIHPIVNEHADHLIAREGLCDRHARDRAHVRVEIGLDAWYFGRSPAARTERIRHAFDARRIRFLHAALLATYSVPFSPRRLLRSHRNVTHFFHLYVRLARLIAIDIGALERRGLLRLEHVRAALGRLVHAESAAAGFLRPVAPSPALLERVDEAIGWFHERMDAAADRIDDLPDYDLETGRLLMLPAAAAAAAA